MVRRAVTSRDPYLPASAQPFIATRTRFDFDDLMGERKYSGQHAYNQSKLANVMFTYELAR